MGSLDDHVASRIHVNNRRMTRVRFHEPDYDRDVISNTLVRHRDGAVGLKKVDGSAIVVCESGGFGFERSVVGGQGE